MTPRRRFLLAALAVGGSCISGRLLAQTYPFALGVASGYPFPSGVTLWTRIMGLDVDQFGSDTYGTGGLNGVA
jgi:phosphodiesterase/alkaline phosphatase D-like protein